MAQRSLAEILAELDTKAITVDPSGRVGSTDPKVDNVLNELRALLGAAPPRLAADNPDGVQCHCTSAR